MRLSSCSGPLPQKFEKNLQVRSAFESRRSGGSDLKYASLNPLVWNEERNWFEPNIPGVLLPETLPAFRYKLQVCRSNIKSMQNLARRRFVPQDQECVPEDTILNDK